MATIEVDFNEYLDLVKKVADLQGKIVAQEQNKEAPKTVTSMLDILPYEHVRHSDETSPVFRPDTCSSCGDAFKTFSYLAKLLHRKDYKFYMSETYHGSNIPYIRMTNREKIPTYKEMTYEQHMLSAEMLNEMIPIWNRYFSQVHTSVLYDATGHGDFERVKVLYED